MLIEAGPVVLPAVRVSLKAEDRKLRQRCIEIVAWQGDRQSLATLEAMTKEKSDDADLAQWAVGKIRSLSLENVNP
jgi:hypothetical protein